MKKVSMIIGLLAGTASLLYVGLYGTLWGGLPTLADPDNGWVVSTIVIFLAAFTIVGGALCAAKPKMGGGLLLVAAVGHACLLGTHIVGLAFVLSLAAAGVLGLASQERDSTGLELVIVYTGLMFVGDYLAYLVGVAVEYVLPAASLVLFLTMYFLLLWGAWVIAVRMTQPIHTASNAREENVVASGSPASGRTAQSAAA